MSCRRGEKGTEICMDLTWEICGFGGQDLGSGTSIVPIQSAISCHLKGNVCFCGTLPRRSPCGPNPEPINSYIGNITRVSPRLAASLSVPLCLARSHQRLSDDDGGHSTGRRRCNHVSEPNEGSCLAVPRRPCTYMK